jgi:molecular chaperone GrpE
MGNDFEAESARAAEAAEQAPGDALAGDLAIQKLEADLHEAGERLLRSQAELENYRKRARRELDDERRYAALPLMHDLLSVVDNLERALDAAQKTGDGASLQEGVQMVATQLVGVLAQHHCQRIESVGTAFDPHLHHAIGQEPSDTLAAGVVSREAQAGYKLHERVVRPAQVFVSTGQTA